MTVTAWDKALFSAPPRIMGRQLQPYSLAHSRALKLLASPYVAGGTVTPADVLVAVSVCSRSLPQIVADVFCSPRKPWESAWALWWGLRLRWNFDRAHAALTAYFHDYACEPDHEDRGGKRYVAPWEFHHVRVLCSVYGVTPAVAWECPMVTARCLYDAHGEANGDESLISSEMAQGYEMIAEANRLAERGLNADADALYERAAPLVRKE